MICRFFLYDQKDICLLAYVKDIFWKLNELNMSIQWRPKHKIQMSDRINGFRGKLAFWRENLRKGNDAAFPHVRFWQTKALLISALHTLWLIIWNAWRSTLPPTFQVWICQHLTGWLTHSTVMRTPWFYQPVLWKSWLSCQLNAVSVEEFWFGARGDYPEVAQCV